MIIKKIPCKLFVEDSQDGLVKCKVTVMNLGKNRNKSKFSEEAVADAEETLKNRPLLAYIKRDEDGEPIDFAGHEVLTKLIQTDEGYDVKFFYLETPIGVFPESCNFRYEEIDGETHVVADAYIWEGYCNEALDLLEDNDNVKDVSMEISVLDSEMDDDGYLDIKKFTFNAVTLLGNDVIQGMNGNCNISLYSNKNYEEFANKINEKLSEKEGKDLDKGQEFGLSVQNITDQVLNQINAQLVETTDYWGDTYQHKAFYYRDLLPDENVVVVEDYCDYIYYGVPYTVNGDNVTLDFENKKEYIAEWREKTGEDPSQVFSRDDEELKNHILDKFNSIDTKEKELEELQIQYNELDEQLKGMSDYAELKEFRNSYDKAKYEKEVNEVLDMFGLDESETKELTEKALNKEFTIDEFKKELALVYSMKQLENKKKDFAKEEDKEPQVEIIDKEKHFEKLSSEAVIEKHLKK